MLWRGHCASWLCPVELALPGGLLFCKGGSWAEKIVKITSATAILVRCTTFWYAEMLLVGFWDGCDRIDGNNATLWVCWRRWSYSTQSRCWMHSEELDRKEGRDFCVKAFLSCRLFIWPLPLASWPSTKRSWVTSTATPRAKHNIAMRGYDEIAGTSGRIWRCWADEVVEVDEITVMKWWG